MDTILLLFLFLALLVVVGIAGGALYLINTNGKKDAETTQSPTSLSSSTSTSTSTSSSSSSSSGGGPAERARQLQQQQRLVSSPLKVLDPYKSKRGGRDLHKLETNRFVFWYGDALPGTETRGTFTSQLSKAAIAVEIWWDYLGTGLGYTMNKRVPADTFKYNIYLMSTGCEQPVDPGAAVSGVLAAYRDDLVGTMGIKAESRFIVTSFGALSHELTHLAQSRTGGFVNNALSGNMWENSAEYMSGRLLMKHDVPTMVGAKIQRIHTWMQSHWKCIASDDPSDKFKYNGYLWWAWLEGKFGLTFPGKMWSQASLVGKGEPQIEAAVRLGKFKDTRDLWGQWISGALRWSYSPEWKSVIETYRKVDRNLYPTWDDVKRAWTVTGKSVTPKVKLERWGFVYMKPADAEYKSIVPSTYTATFVAKPGAGYIMVVVDLDAKTPAPIVYGGSATAKTVKLKKTQNIILAVAMADRASTMTGFSISFS